VKRLFWAGLGLATGVLLTRRATSAAHALTPAGMTDRLAESITTLGDALREFGQDMRDAMWDREEELHAALGLSDVPPEPAPSRSSPTAPGGVMAPHSQAR
jgi:hypothetical protein